MKVQIVGKKFLKGASKKTGELYEATLVSMVYPYPNYTGHKAEEVYVSNSLLKFENLEVGDTYDMERDNGFVLAFNKVK